MLSATRVRVKESGTKAWNVFYYRWHMICYCCIAIAHGRDPKAQPEQRLSGWRQQGTGKGARIGNNSKLSVDT